MAGDLNVEEAEVQVFIDEIKEPLPLKKKILFYVITLSIPVLFFVAVEGILRSMDYMGNTDLFIDPEIPSDQYYIPNPNFTARYFFYTKTLPSPSIDVFLQEKPENGYRVFAMGGSSAAGYPYGFNGSFSRVVDDILTDAMPDREVEVVNVATSAISTYTLYDQVDEIIAQNPDAIMIYAGHNEFYGALGVGSNETLGGFPGFVRFYLELQQYKTFLLLREMIVSTGQWLAGGPENTEAKRTGGTLMERIIKDQAIPLNGTTHQMAMNQFQSNMSALISRFEAEGIPVYLSTIGSNEKDQPPFVSLDDNNLPPAEEVYQEALTSYNQGDIVGAKTEFTYAKDLDGLKFRAPSQVNHLIDSLAQSLQNTKLVPVQQVFEQESENGIIGNGLMLEHLHPNQKGYFLMGRTFAEAILQDLAASGTTDPVKLDLNTYFEEMHITEFDERVVYHQVKTLKQGFPFVTDGSAEPYQVDYNPTGVIDSLAFAMVHMDKRWDEAKVEVARYHITQNQTERALAEYYGLIRNQPWNESPYVFAARLLLDQNDFDRAEPLLEKAYQLNPQDAFITKMLGAVNLNQGNTEEAIRLLEESRRLNPQDPQTLYNLSGAYGTNREFEKALKAANEVSAINPNFPGIQQWKQQLTRIINSRRN